MLKKLISMVVLTVMVFSFAACNQASLSNENELVGYKASAISELEAYAESKGQDNYLDTDWETIMLLSANAKLEIDEATDKLAVDAAVKTAKQSIDEIYTLSDGLETCKMTAKTALENYAKEKEEDNYTVENWAIICSLVEEGKAAIDAAVDELAVDAAQNGVKQAIDNVIIRKFYSLQEAYEGGLIAFEDLINIAFYQNGGRAGNEEIMAIDFAPTPKIPTELSMTVKENIKEDKAYSLRNQIRPNGKPLFPDATANDITIDRYYGTYNNCVALMLSNSYVNYPDAVWNEKIAGVLFHYADGRSIVIWKQ